MASRRFILHGLLFLLTFGGSPGFAYDVRDNAIRHDREGMLMMDRKRYGEAIEEFKIGLRLNPTSTVSARIYNNLGMAYQKTGQYDLALVSFQRAIRLEPQFALFFANLAETYRLAGRLPRARTVFRSVVRRNPIDGQAWFMLGLLEEKAGRLQDARTAFTKFINLEPASRLSTAARAYL